MSEARRGLLSGVAAYGLWGLFPLFWPLLEPAHPVEILAHRMVWSLAVVAVVLTVTGRWRRLRPVVARPRRLGLLAAAAALISVNWGVYIYGVNSGHVVETALGYFINPLVSVVLGVVLLGERLRRAQWAAVGLGAAAVAVLALEYGHLPWIALVLALSFGGYGFLKKKADVEAVESLAVETAVLFLPALAYLLVLGATGTGTFTALGPGHAALLASAGVVTAVPLLCFGAAAIRVPLTVIGLLQYLTPSMQFLIGVLLYDEAMPPGRLAGFAVVWLALVVLSMDAVRAARRRRVVAGAVTDAQPADTAKLPIAPMSASASRCDRNG